MRDYVVDRVEAGKNYIGIPFQAVNDSLAKMEGKGIARQNGWYVIEIWDVDADMLVGNYTFNIEEDRWKRG